MKNESILKFKEYYIDEFIFQKNNNFSYEQDHEIALDINFSFESKRKEELFIKQIQCTIFDENYQENRKPFYINIKLSGVFNIIGFDEQDHSHNEIINKNTLAILFPYLRSLISHMSLEMQVEPIVLPPININSFFEE